MIRLPEELTFPVTGRHCTNYQCRKCIARAKWYRRKAWRSGKNQHRRKSGRK